MKKFLIPILSLAIACGQTDEPVELDPEVIAEAAIFSLNQLDDKLYELKANSVGHAKFTQVGQVVTLEISLEGMTPNTSKAVHIHNGTAEVPGRHWNRGSYIVACGEYSLGEVWAKPFAGDVGNIPIDAEGKGQLTLQTDMWAINTGDEKDLLNKVIIVHEGPQDFIVECDPFHDHTHDHNNPKIGGGTIELVSDVPLVDQEAIVISDPPAFTICN